MQIHSITPYSTVNGPGTRAVIHFQGCKFSCVGCFNPETHPLDGGNKMSLTEIISAIPHDVDGVTISGGEPFLQTRGLLALVTFIKAILQKPIIVFSGFHLNEINNLKFGPNILSKIDVLIDGRFQEDLLSVAGLHGSENQNIHIFTDVYKREDFEERKTEFIISLEGKTVVTGFPSEGILEKVK